MKEISAEQIRNFRLCSHHLDRTYQISDIPEIAGACGLQNTPPGAFETAFFNRVADCGLQDLRRLVYEEKTLLQAWSFRGAPVVFPVSESGTFLSALIPEDGEPWIYTAGVALALDFVQLSFEQVWEMLRQVLPRLDDHRIAGKAALDQTLAEWMLPLLPEEKRELWKRPSMYGRPDIQTAGGAAVSFLLRPASFCGLVVLGEREKSSQVFTSFQNWTGRLPDADKEAGKKLVRKYLHCYGPATAAGFETWLGCSGQQARRLWQSISEEMEPVQACGKRAFILSADREQLLEPVPIQSRLFLLGGHDPYLDQRDRTVLLSDQSLHKQVWRLVTNPGVILYDGEIAGIWTGKKKGKSMEFQMTLWKEIREKERLKKLAEGYAAFRQLKLAGIEIQEGRHK